jgi:hypothetical protein
LSAKQKPILISLLSAIVLLFGYSLLIEFLFLTESGSLRTGCPLPIFEPDPFFHALNVTADRLYDTKIGIKVWCLAVFIVILLVCGVCSLFVITCLKLFFLFRFFFCL